MGPKYIFPLFSLLSMTFVRSSRCLLPLRCFLALRHSRISSIFPRFALCGKKAAQISVCTQVPHLLSKLHTFSAQCSQSRVARGRKGDENMTNVQAENCDPLLCRVRAFSRNLFSLSRRGRNHRLGNGSLGEARGQLER